MDSYSLLIGKLEEFKKKYYLNRLLKGFIISIGLVLAAYLAINVFEYAAHFGMIARAIIFYCFIAVSAIISVRYIIVPLIKLLNIGKTISYEEASLLIGRHFTDVQDKLINTLQLKQLAGNLNNELINASVNQKIKELSPVPFKNAINYTQNMRYARLALIPVLLFVVVLFTNSRIITESTQRLINYTVPYEKMAPFTFDVQNKDLKCYKGENFTIRLSVNGTSQVKEIPNDVVIEQDGKRFRMSKTDLGEFEFTINNVQKDLPFRFHASGFVSDDHTLKIIPKASIASFNVKLEYPSYIGRKTEQVNNQGDITIPEGTRIHWMFNTDAVSDLKFVFEKETDNAASTSKGLFSFDKSFTKNTAYKILIFNEYTKTADTLEHHINVVPDAYPIISVEEHKDTSSRKWLYFAGTAIDDYGISRITFNYHFTNSDDPSKLSKGYTATPLSGASGLSKNFTQFWNMGELNIQPGDELEYFFEVWDNDGINGSKSARSSVHTYNIPTEEELKKETDKQSKALKTEMADALKRSKELSKEMEQLNRKLLDKNQLSWEDKKQFEKLLEKQKALQKEIDEIKQQNKQNNEKEQEFANPEQNNEILQKQEELQKLFEETLTDEMKQKMEELEKMMKEMNKDEMQRQLDQMKMDNKDVNKQLDRMLEMYKQLEVEKKMDKAIQDLKDLSKQQKDLKEKTEKAADKADQKTQDALKQEQKKLNEKFDDIKKDMKDLEQKNQELEKPNDLGLEKTEEEKKDIDQNMDQSEKDLENKKNKDAAQKQKKAADKMEEMANKMEQQMQEQEQEQQGEDFQKLRQILENLVTISKEQEAVMEGLRSTPDQSPAVVPLAQRQRKIKDDFKMIEDSLQALGKRVRQVSSYINKELNDANKNIDYSLSDLGKRWISNARGHQYYTMTSMNNLAVMLSEALKQMQDEMQSNSSSSGQSCKKPKSPGQGKQKSMSEMKKMQDEINRQINEMKKKQQGQNQNKGDGKSGSGSDSKGGNTPSKEWAQIAAQQEALRRHLQQLQKEMQKDGTGGQLGDLQKTQQLMDEIEKDLVNKRITDQTLKRLKEIEVRLLDHEKAEKEQEMDKQRKANTAKEIERKVPPALEKYLKEKNREVELLQTLPADIKPYFKEKVKEYFRLLNQ